MIRKRVKEQLGCLGLPAMQSTPTSVALPFLPSPGITATNPIQAMTMIATCCGEYGFDVVASHVSAHIMSVVQAQFPNTPARRP
jgi:hypothetical protein